MPHENGFLSEMLLKHGCNTYAVGKWHLTAAEQIMSGDLITDDAATLRMLMARQ